MQRLNAILVGVFGGLALLLATAGIYGVLSYSISHRTSVIGLRVAMGASPHTCPISRLRPIDGRMVGEHFCA